MESRGTLHRHTGQPGTMCQPPHNNRATLTSSLGDVGGRWETVNLYGVA